MPLYNVASPGALSPEDRKRIADSILETHCAITKAPPAFVNVVFPQGFKLRRGLQLSMIGSVRGGGNRDASTMAELQRALRTRTAAAINADPGSVEVELLELPASWVIEGGKILPDPGDEAGWQDV